MNCSQQATTISPRSAIAGLFESDTYTTQSCRFSALHRACLWNSAFFYWDFLKLVRRGAGWAKRGQYTRQNWFDLSFDVVRMLERNGGCLDVAGLSHLHAVDGPVVLVSNHMSTLETVVIPCLVLKHSDLCITLKEQLFKVPVFRTLLRGFRTIAVSRTSPIDDYKTIMREGSRAVAEGYSVLVFPQSTRTTQFSPEEFNSVGVKLARRVSVPLVPLALKTDFWGSGRIVKDFGPLSRDKKIYFRFGPPISVESKGGKQEHQQVVDFIQTNLARWQNT
jgi:1-acyl-sn-glycerol-3-phosphate acyltransferase